MTPKTHRSKKGPKLYPIEKESKGLFDKLRKYQKEYEKQKLADEEIKEYTRKK